MKRPRTIARFRIALISSLLVLINWTALPGYGHDDSDHARSQLSTTIGSWSFTGRLNTSHSGHTATLLPNRKVLVAGGASDRSAELYDSVTETWTATGELSIARVSHTATLLANGKVLVVGGADWATGVTSSNSAELYDPETGTWSNTGVTNVAHSEHTATRLPNGKVLVVGGRAGDVPINSVELYDPDTERWSTTGSLNIGRFLHTASVLQSGEVLIAGGAQDRIRLTGLDSAELFDPDTGTWSVTGSLKIGRLHHTSTVLSSGNVMIANGARSWGWDTNSAEIYNPSTRKWSRTGDLIAPSEGHTATLFPNGGILIVGGSDASFDLPVYSAELYDPESGAWRNTGALNITRSSHTATLLPNGKVLVAGGAGYEPNSAELYDPTAIVTPRILSASVSGKTLLVSGENFEPYGSVILLNGEEKKTLYDDGSRRTLLISKKAAKKIKPGDKLQVRNVDGTLSQEFIFTGS